MTIKKLFRSLLALLGITEGDKPAVHTTTPPAPSDPATGTPAALTPKPATLCEPEKGVECPTPWGMDVRFLAWSGDDWAFVGCDEAVKATTRNGKAITGADWTRNGIRYVYAGYRVPHSSSPLIAERTGQYAETYRLYYWPTRESARAR